MPRPLWLLAMIAYVSAVGTPAVASEVSVEESATAEELCDAAQRALDLELLDQALALFGRALAADPADPCSLEGIARVQKAQSSAAASKPSEAQKLCDAGDAAADAGQRDKAREFYLSALEKDASDDCAKTGLTGLQTWTERAQSWVERNVRVTWGDLVWAIGAILVATLTLRWLRDKADLWLIRPFKGLIGMVGDGRNRTEPRMGTISLTVSGDDESGLEGRIRSTLGNLGLRPPSPAGGSAESIAKAVTEAAPSGTAILTALPRLWMQLKPGRLHRVIVTPLERDTKPTHGIAIEMAGRTAKTHHDETAWAKTQDDAADEAAWIIFDHVATGHWNTQWGVRKRRTWEHSGSFHMFRSGVASLEKGNCEGAAATLSHVAAIEPDNVQAALWRSRAEQYSKRYGSAAIVLLDAWHKQKKVTLNRSEKAEGHVALLSELAAVFSYAGDWESWQQIRDRFTSDHKDDLAKYHPDGVTFPTAEDEVTNYGLQVAAQIYSALRDKASNAECSAAECIVALQLLNEGLSPCLCSVRVANYASFKAKLIEVTNEDLAGHWNRALFYSRGIEEQNSTGEEKDERAQAALEELSVAVSNDGWTTVFSNWLYLDPDLKPLRLHDGGATWKEWTQRPASAYTDPTVRPDCPERVGDALNDAGSLWEEVMEMIKASTGTYPTSRVDLEFAAQLTIALGRSRQVDQALKGSMTSITQVTLASAADQVAVRYKDDIQRLAGALKLTK